MLPPVISVLLAFVATWCRSSASLRLENLALRHQLAVYQQRVPRPRLRPSDRVFWAWLSRLWSGWQAALAFVQPRTVIAWQRKRFRDHWRRLSQQGTPGRPALIKEVRDLIRAMWQANPTWGSPRIAGELQKLGLNVAKSTVEKYRPRVRKPSSPTWKTFLTNHIHDIVACDFFIVPTATFRVLFVFVMLAHERRRIVHFNITEHPTAQWTAQQIVEAFPWDTAPRYLLRDRDSIYGTACQSRVKNLGIEEIKIAPHSPWQNPYCERLIGSIRRDVLAHVIVLNEQHLRRVLTAYISYYLRFRTHLSLDMDCPQPRAVEPPEVGKVRALPEVGGLHHHYERQAA
jgi:transposase InsO family protein